MRSSPPTATSSSTDKWGFREALMRSFRRRQIFPDHVRFMTEDAVRWQPTGAVDPHSRPRLQRAALRRGPRTAGERQELSPSGACAWPVRDGPEVTPECFQLVAPAARLPKGVVQASPAARGVRACRRGAPRLTAGSSSTSSPRSPSRARWSATGELFEMNGGCTVVIDPQGDVRYAIYKKFDE